MKIFLKVKDWKVHPTNPMKTIYEDEGGKKYIGRWANIMVGDIMFVEVGTETGKESYPSIIQTFEIISPQKQKKD